MSTTTKRKEDFETIGKIIERAESMGVSRKHQRMERFLDLDKAHEQFNLRLDDFLKADDFNFLHDFCGIYSNMNRHKGKLERFVPRFAKGDI